MLNKYEKLTEPGRMINNIFANVNAGIEAGKKPPKERKMTNAIQNKDQRGTKPLDTLLNDMGNAKDKFFDAIDSVSKKKSLDPYIKTLIDKIEGLEREKATLREALHKAGELIEEIKNDNFEDELGELKVMCSKDQLARLAYIMKRNKEDNNKKGAL